MERVIKTTVKPGEWIKLPFSYDRHGWNKPKGLIFDQYVRVTRVSKTNFWFEIPYLKCPWTNKVDMRSENEPQYITNPDYAKANYANTIVGYDYGQGGSEFTVPYEGNEHHFEFSKECGPVKIPDEIMPVGEFHAINECEVPGYHHKYEGSY